MADLLLDLVPRLKPAPRVTVDEYLAIQCNRCGGCCEDIRSPHGPDELAMLLADGAFDADRQSFCAGLVPVESLVKGWRYRCKHFRRDAEGSAACAIYDQRPQVCRAYPNGGSVRRWSQCAFYVQIVGLDGSVIPSVPPPEECCT